MNQRLVSPACDHVPTSPSYQAQESLKRRRHELGLVVPSFDQGGGVPTVAMFIRRIALASGRYDVRVVSLASARNDQQSLRLLAPTSWRKQPSQQSRSWCGIDFEHVGARMSEFEFQRYRPRRVLGDALAKCDLIQVVCGVPAWANGVLGLGKPVALQVATRTVVERLQRDAKPRGVAGWWRKRMTSITDRMDDAALRQVNAIQVENPWMLEYARDVCAARDIDIRYAPPGIDANRYVPLPAAARMSDPYILCVGRLDDPRKNVGLLLDAYAHLPAALRAQVRLVMAGAGTPPTQFWDQAESLGVRTRITHVAKPDADALRSLYQHASVLALPSDEEGFGMVVIEAMACGVPVVATRCGGPDGIISDGDDGFLVPRNEAAALSERLQRLLQDPQMNEAMGASARATIIRRYDERVAGTAFLDIWDRLMQRSGAGPCAD